MAAALLLLGAACGPTPTATDAKHPSPKTERPRKTEGSRSFQEAAPAEKAPPRWVVERHPQLRKLTVAVHVTPPPALIGAYKTLAARHRTLEPVLLGQAEGGFGSGFVMIERAPTRTERRAFFVTNAHVVGLSDRATIEFEGVETQFSARVLYVDDTYDLAILTLENEEAALHLPVEAGFDLQTTPPRDQEPVVASGYPGIAGRPSYQVTRGFVSNERLVLPINGKERVHIQHTAPIDPGSSGGPLLDQNGRVLGINTLKIHGREGVGVAVPSLAIADALERAAGSLAPDTASGAHGDEFAVCEELFEQIARESEICSVERNLATSLVAEQGPDSLAALPRDGTDWKALFARYPEDVLLHALAVRVRQTLHRDDDEKESRRCERVGDREDGTPVTFRVLVGGRPKTLTFIREQGRYKLSAIEFDRVAARSFLSQPPKRGPWKPSLR